MENLAAFLLAARALWSTLISQPVGRLLVALGTLQLILIAIQELIDVFDIVEPILDAVLCDEETTT